MSKVAEHLTRAGATIDEALGQLVDQADVTARIHAVQMLILANQRIADDRHEMVMAKLDRVLAVLGTNGSGGEHA